MLVPLDTLVSRKQHSIPNSRVGKMLADAVADVIDAPPQYLAALKQSLDATNVFRLPADNHALNTAVLLIETILDRASKQHERPLER